MSKIIKRSLLFILIISSLLLLPYKGIEADGSYRIVIDDQEDLLSSSQETMLEMKMQEILKYGNAGFLTVSQYSDTGSFAKKMYREYFGHDSGILFVIDMGRRNIWIYSDGAVYRVINRPYANTITDNVYRMATRGEYFECAYNVFDQAETLLKGGKISQPMKYISNLLIATVSALLINFYLLIMQQSSEHKVFDPRPAALTTAAGVNVISKRIVKQRRSRHVESSGGGGGGFSGGGGGGGGGGGSSGGGGGHSF
ncbi:MAG: TPM domain-containing protein [Erysipelotrichaceae bacterium]|nr:TPM domain-containing protein [Erysipelotrichaceae bacterium]